MNSSDHQETRTAVGSDRSQHSGNVPAAAPKNGLFFTALFFPVRSLVSAASAWNRFWFAPADPTTLGLIRLLAGGMLVYTHLIWGTQLSQFFGTTGWQTAEALNTIQEGAWAPSIWWLVSDSRLMPVHCLCLTVLVLFWIGFATRVTSVLSLIITISYAYRTQMAGFGLDQINTILCFYLCIGPCGAALSVDRWRAVRRARRGNRTADSVLPSSSANLALRLIQVHFCVIYTWAGLAKAQGPAWWNGEAVWMALANLEYQSLDMTWIAWYPWLGELMTHTAILWELSFAALIWIRPLRPWVLAVGAMLHVGIGGAMGMWTFGLIMIFGHVAFWPNEWVQAVVRWIPGSATAVIPSAASPSAAPAPETSPATRPAISAARHPDASPVLPTADVSGRIPSVLCVGGSGRRRLACLGYFTERGYRCTVTDSPDEARAVRDATTPDAVIVLGTALHDDDIRALLDQHHDAQGNEPLFLILSPDQSNRFNGYIAAPNSHVYTGAVSLGVLRRQIEQSLNVSGTSPSSERSDSSP